MTTQREIAGATSASLAGATVVVVPVGSIEQHGPHLPLDTDTVIATAVARRVVDALPDARLAPALTYGASGEHQTFPGTTSIGTDVLRQTLVELVRSMRTWAEEIVFVNAHGGNLVALDDAVGQLLAEGHRVAWIPCQVASGDAHAGQTETSLMLFLAPWSVRSDRIAAGTTRPLDEILPALRAGGVAAVSANGVLGDPRGATAALGRKILDSMVATALDRLHHPVA